ncbi:MAG: glycosyltransferase, partial [Dehalococcoidales bacterium]|nr:glycosyltransferase [Dehalococcoidales bacterium]
MRILSITAQKPCSTGSGVYLTELVRSWKKAGHEQIVVAGVASEEESRLPVDVELDTVSFDTPELPFHICGMSDEMPYPSTRYSDLTDDMVAKFKEAFMVKIRDCVERLDPDLIVCHHLYLLTAFVREAFPDRKIVGFCHGSDLRQIGKNPLEREYIKKEIKHLDAVFTL